MDTKNQDLESDVDLEVEIQSEIWEAALDQVVQETILPAIRLGIKNETRSLRQNDLAHLARSLAINGFRLQSTIELTCRRHREAEAGVTVSEKLEEIAETQFCSESYRELLKRNNKYWHRESSYWERLLDQFEVVLSEPNSGDEFDPELHIAHGTVFCSKVELANTIEEAKNYCYVWTDENGVRQVIEAEVVLRTDEP